MRAVARPVSPPPSATIQALIDMGFNRRAAEHALKALGGQGNLNPSPESIVGWLLEHQDQVMELQEPGGQVQLQQGTGDTEAQ